MSLGSLPGRTCATDLRWGPLDERALRRGYIREVPPPIHPRPLTLTLTLFHDAKDGTPLSPLYSFVFSVKASLFVSPNTKLKH